MQHAARTQLDIIPDNCVSAHTHARAKMRAWGDNGSGVDLSFHFPDGNHFLTELNSSRNHCFTETGCRTESTGTVRALSRS